MDKRTRGVFIARVMAEVMLFCLLTGCAYGATEQVLPKLETREEVQSAEPTPSTLEKEDISEIEAPEETVEERRIQSIPAEGLLGDEIVPEMTLEEAMEAGNIVLPLDVTFEEEGLGGLLPGLGEGTWYGIDVEGIYYIYGYYREIDRVDFFTYIITDEKYELGNGLKVGLAKAEALALCPELLEVELTMDDVYWNGSCYPACWTDQFDCALVVDLENDVDDLPVYLALFMQDEKVVAISPYYPTAG